MHFKTILFVYFSQFGALLQNLVTRFPACIWNYIFTWKWKTCKQSTKAKNKKITFEILGQKLVFSPLSST